MLGGALILLAWGFYEVRHKAPIVGLRTTARLPVLLTNLGGRLTLAIGSAVLSAGYLIAIFMTDAPWELMVATCIACVGVGIAYAAMPALILDNVPRDEVSSNVGVNALMRSIGFTVSGAVMAIVLTSHTTTTDDGATIPSHGAFQLCFLIAAGAALITVPTIKLPRALAQQSPSHVQAPIGSAQV